mgnify:CR=1 FL=1
MRDGGETVAGQPIRDLVTILETLADYAPHTKHIDVLIEYTRNALAPTITRQFQGPDESIHAFVLDAMLEQMLLHKAETGELNPNTLGLEPDRAEQFAQEADRLSKKIISTGRAAPRDLHTRGAGSCELSESRCTSTLHGPHARTLVAS